MDGRTDGQNYDSQDRASIAASRDKNQAIGTWCRWLVRFLGALTELRDRFSELTCPFFILQGTEDKVTDPAGAQMLYDNASSVNKRIKVRVLTRDQ